MLPCIFLINKYLLFCISDINIEIVTILNCKHFNSEHTMQMSLSEEVVLHTHNPT